MTNREYDIMLVDERGTGWSAPLTCGFANENLENAVNVNDTTFSGEEPLSFEWISEFVLVNSPVDTQKCVQNEDPLYLAHLNAPNVARDLDLIRNLTGFDTLNYYAQDYGGIIAITYASLFPDRVGNMVLDFVRDFEAWTGVTGNLLDYYFEKYSGIHDVIQQFASLCVAAYQSNPKYCPLAAASINSVDPGTATANRISSIFDYLLKTEDGVYVSRTDTTWTFFDILIDMPVNFRSISSMYQWAQIYLDLETAIQSQTQSSQMKRDIVSTLNISFSSLHAYNSLAGIYNNFTHSIIDCVDSKFTDINDTTSFSNYVLHQAGNDSLAAYSGLLFGAPDIPCPNLASYNPENYPTQFSANLRNKIIIVGRTYFLGYPIKQAMNTYNFVGPENAVILVLDSYGDSGVGDCNVNIIKLYFGEGNVPENGTVCRANYSGMNNPFIQDYLALPQDGGNLRFRTSLGVGFGVIVVVISVILVAYWNHRRKLRKVSKGKNPL